MRVLPLVPLIVSCSRRPSACEELRQQTPDGFVLATDEKRCAQLVDFAATVPERYGMDFQEWIGVVPAQRARLTLETIYSLTERTTWQPTTVPRSPAEIDCGGSELSDDAWNQSALSKIVPSRPKKLYVSLSIEFEKPNRARIRIHQDFDCDSTLGVMEVIGDYQQGTSPFAGGWTALSAQEPEIDE